MERGFIRGGNFTRPSPSPNLSAHDSATAPAAQSKSSDRSPRKLENHWQSAIDHSSRTAAPAPTKAHPRPHGAPVSPPESDECGTTSSERYQPLRERPATAAAR